MYKSSFKFSVKGIAEKCKCVSQKSISLHPAFFSSLESEGGENSFLMLFWLLAIVFQCFLVILFNFPAFTSFFKTWVVLIRVKVFRGSEEKEPRSTAVMWDDFKLRVTCFRNLNSYKRMLRLTSVESQKARKLKFRLLFDLPGQFLKSER